MKLKEMYEIMVKNGIKNDPRGLDSVNLLLEEKKKEFNDLKEDQKEEFDKESLWNPYGDTRIVYGDPDREVENIISGIDVDVGEIVLVDRLREKNLLKNPVIVAHHPTGTGIPGLAEVMTLQNELFLNMGIPINVAEALMSDRIGEVERTIHALNNYRARDAARLLDIPLVCCHTAADNCAQQFMAEKIKERNPTLVGEVLKVINEIPEYQEAKRLKMAPNIIAGAKKNRAGEIIVEFTGGTSYSKDLYEKISQAGVGTLVTMHMREDHLKEAKKHHLNVVIASHMFSDSLGMNIILDEFEKKQMLIKSFSGFFRFTRA